MSIIPFITADSIKGRIEKLVIEIESKITLSEQEPLVLIGVLKGAAVFVADLMRALSIPSRLEFVRITSYGDSTVAGQLKTPDLSLPSDITRQKILIVEDIVDTGHTALFLKRYIQDQFQPSKLLLASLLNKPSRREVGVEPDFYGFEIEDKFVVGYGLDYAERYRELSYLGVLDDESQN